MVHFRVPSDCVLATMPHELKQQAYELFVSLDGSLSPADDGAPLPAGYYVATKASVLKARVEP